jgi:hypothetical protein
MTEVLNFNSMQMEVVQKVIRDLCVFPMCKFFPTSSQIQCPRELIFGKLPFCYLNNDKRLPLVEGSTNEANKTNLYDDEIEMLARVLQTLPVALLIDYRKYDEIHPNTRTLKEIIKRNKRKKQ